MRGGRVKLAAISAPPTEYSHEEKGDALYAMELALALEKLNFQMLFELHETADKHNDPNFSDFLEDMLAEQVCFPGPFCSLYHCSSEFTAQSSEFTAQSTPELISVCICFVASHSG